MPCPCIQMVYSDCMGGVCLLVSVLGYHRMQVKSKKCT
jgi:hypothetical protein